MRPTRLFALLLFLTLPLAACEADTSEQEGATSEAAASAEPLPASTDSEEARTHYGAGWRSMDMGRFDEANDHFTQATDADPTFAMGYYGMAISSNSLESFKAAVEQAVANAENATEIEQARIEELRASMEGDMDARRAAADRLVELAPNSPRAYVILAGVQSAASDEAGARASLEKAIELNPESAVGHMALVNSLMFVEPIDLAAAQTHAERAAAIEPDEAITHDLLGDVYRAQGNLEQAATEYGRTAELETGTGNGYQQRGHVHSFLGNYAEARADYDAAIEIEAGTNSAPAFAVYRALVSVHEGNPGAAVEELMTLADEIDSMGVPNPNGSKIFALQAAATIAAHEGMLDEAEAAVDEMTALMDEQASKMGTANAQRNATATKAIWSGWLAARRGNYDAALASAEEARTALEAGNDPDRFENVHELIGFVELERGNAAEAVTHLDQANPDDIYTNYLHAKALEASGDTEAANALYTKIAEWRFNDPDLAIVRAEVMEKVGG